MDTTLPQSPQSQPKAVSSEWSTDKAHSAGSLLREMSLINSQLEPELSADSVFKRVQFLGYELTTIVTATPDIQARLSLLNRFFFEKKEFQAVHDDAYSSDVAPLYLLQKIMVSRVGSSLLVALLYSYLAEQLGIHTVFVDLHPTCFLKYFEEGRSRFIDLSKGGKTFSSEELIDTIERRFKVNDISSVNLCESISKERIMVEFLRSLKSAYAKREDGERMLLLQNLLMDYQPNNFSLLGERAILHRKLGKFKSAFNDLKRYFTFQERSKAPTELVKIFDELKVIFQTHKAHIEILD